MKLKFKVLVLNFDAFKRCDITKSSYVRYQMHFEYVIVHN